jgi:DNA-binding protein HU-beta
MQSREIIDAIATETGLQKTQVESVLDSFCKSTIETLKAGDEVRYKRLGAFTARLRPERQGRNPRTGDPATIPAARMVKFKPNAEFKAALQG